MRKSLICVSAFFLMALVGINVCGAKGDTDPMKVFVSILPQKYFVERVGGDLVDVSVMVGPGQSPHTYEPTPRQMADLSKAKIFFRIGVPFEKAIIRKIKSTFKNVTVVDTRKGIKLRQMDEGADDAHEHPKHHEEAEEQHHDKKHDPGHSDEHHHHAGEPDPHIWLDPILVKTQAKTICDALSKVDPKHAAEYRKNLKKFQNDLDAINARIGKVLAPLKGGEVFVFHPAFGYFTDRYGLKQVAVETGGKEPSARQLASLIDRAKETGAKVIFVQPQFDRRSAETIAKAIGGAVVPLNPLAADYIKNLEGMASKVESALSTQK